MCIRDRIVGARGFDADDSGISEGVSYLVYGQDGNSEIDLSNFEVFTSTNGFKINGASDGDASGTSVSGAGDINGDGFNDLIVGAPSAEGHLGSSYVVYGRAIRDGDVNLEDFDQIDDVFKINGEWASGKIGFSVSGAGDVNGDGYADLIVGAPGIASSKGASYVVYGQKDTISGIQLNDFDGDSTAGFSITGANNMDESGTSVSGAGDVNGDGYSDVIIGAPRVSNDVGVSYVVYGKDGNSSIDLSNFISGTDGFKITGASNGDRSGTSVSSAGDVNGDGYDDVIIGAPLANGRIGISYVVYGQSENEGGDVVLDALGADGFKITSVSGRDSIGTSVSSAGDVNGDGYADLIVGAPWADTSDFDDVGVSYIVYGQATRSSDVDLSDFDNSNNAGFKVTGTDYNEEGEGLSGRSVSDAGDINNDDFDDVIIGAPQFNNYAGASYVVYGGPSNYDRLNDTQTGTGMNDNLVGSHGSDILIGNGGQDVLIGGAGDDVLAISDTDFIRIDGGNGEDTLRLDSAITLDLSNDQFKRISIKNIEVINMGETSSSLTLRPIDLLNLSVTSNKLKVTGGAVNMLTLHGSWNIKSSSFTTTTWENTNGIAVVEVDNTISISMGAE